MSEITAFANRLGKNAKHLIKWARRQNIEAWRLYDRDIPQYPFAIDIYGNHAHLQEYDTGWIMQHAEYEAWLAEVVEAVQFITGFPAEHIHLKQRSRQRGSSQYEKTGRSGEDFIVHENGRAFWVNLDKYLDTGLFLDHRNTRALVGSEAQVKRFLNLFSYTGSFSVYAATGGAASSETVDLSNTYLDWARRNFELNHINPEQHHIIRADVFQDLQLFQQQKDARHPRHPARPPPPHPRSHATARARRHALFLQQPAQLRARTRRGRTLCRGRNQPPIRARRLPQPQNPPLLDNQTPLKQRLPENIQTVFR